LPESEPATGGNRSGVVVELGLLGSGLGLRLELLVGVVLNMGVRLGVGVAIAEDAWLAAEMLCSASKGPRLKGTDALDTTRGPVVVHALAPNATTLAVAVRATTLDAFEGALL
jgi:hypothetical protein